MPMLPSGTWNARLWALKMFCKPRLKLRADSVCINAVALGMCAMLFLACSRCAAPSRCGTFDVTLLAIPHASHAGPTSRFRISLKYTHAWHMEAHPSTRMNACLLNEPNASCGPLLWVPRAPPEKTGYNRKNVERHEKA